jgi:FkbM family methyltransferase
MKTYNVRGVDIHLLEVGEPTEIFTDNYKVFDKGLTFQPNDIIIDIGCNVGFFSIMMAKIYPLIKIYAFDPMPGNISVFQENLRLNNITNVICYRCAVSGKSGNIKMIYSPDDLGGSSAYATRSGSLKEIEVQSITLDEIFELFSIDKCRLLKIDCEGAEYDIIYNTSVMNKIENVVGEFHMNNTYLKGQTWDALAGYISKTSNMLYYEWCEMAQ